MKVCTVCRKCYEDAAFSCSEENHESLIEVRAESCEIVPNYLLESLHESFAEGDIYRAVNTILKKPYFIKVIAPEAIDAASKKQFSSEAQSLSAIIHPNVVRVFESGTLADGSVYVVTESFTAQTLCECLDNVGAPSEVTALTITRQAAEGLEALHAAGIVHRNIRPENIILTADAENRFLVKLQNIDFGAIHEQQVISNPERNISDLRYFSPEQCAAQATDTQTDVYSLGVVLFETLAGRVPFDSPYADALLKKQISETPPEVKIQSFDIRMLLTHTLTDALQKTNRTRLKSANAFARRIRHMEQLATHSSTPPPAMSYPATMNKAAVIFTPPVKVEKTEPVPAQIETVIENRQAAEKIESLPVPVELQTAVEALPPVESAPVIETQTIFDSPVIAEETENSVPVEAETISGNPFITENPAPAEIPALLESESVIEELPLAENPAVVEDLSEAAPVIFEAAPVIEDLIAVETQTAAEEAPPEVEAQTIMEETPAAVEAEAALENLPLVEAQAAFEEIPVENQTAFEVASEAEMPIMTEDSAPVEDEVFEDLPAIEARASFENSTPVEIEAAAAEDSLFSETEPRVEEPIFVETELEDSISVEARPVVEEVVQAELQREEPVLFEIEPVMEDALPVETQAAEEEPETQIFINLTTTKLPPVESIIERRPPENIVITEISPIFSMKEGFLDIHKTSEPVVVEWEQPDDLPTVTQALDASKKEFADAAFAPEFESEREFIEDDEEDFVIDAGDDDLPVYVSSANTNARPDYAAEYSVFAAYDDSGTTWNLPDKRKILTGVGLAAVLVLVAGGTLLSRQFITARASQQTTAQSTSDKKPPVLTEPVKVSETDKSSTAKPEDLTVSKPAPSSEDSEIPELPNYQPRETDAQTVLPVSTENRSKKRALKEAVEKLERTAMTKTAAAASETPVFDKKGNPKALSDKNPAVKKPGMTPGKTDIFSRPRIVKTPKS